MRVLEVTTTARATVTERWLILVDDDTAAAILDDPVRFLDAAAGNELHSTVLSVDNINVEDEEDREVTRVDERGL